MKKTVEQQIHTLCIAFCGAHELERISVAEEKTKIKEDTTMAVVSMKQLLEAGVHFGHQTRRWNPKWHPTFHREKRYLYYRSPEDSKEA